MLALQEATARSLPLWRAALAEIGLPHVVSSLDEAPAVREPVGPRRTGVPAASASPLEAIPGAVAVPWPETVISVLCETIEAAPAVLCGDFNTPRSERPDGTILTFARDQHGRLRPERGERWDAAELGILTGLWPDAFRALHGYERKEISWNWPRFPRSGYRLDHMFSTLAPRRCEYVHEVRTTRLSDHSAMEVDL